ncbi:uncharacterized protein LOC108221050 [Daucus carota subsp. sativus]|uniref:uncharacterized protein LOC108221050 n=1 Tax=Daucus carota subsp. sativus TaxID=79200 RepID=UPI0007B2E6BA|nr:PREDICTED: uncharacterized protein LOC108221050 [Daucus carota subsp. sativus]
MGDNYCKGGVSDKSSLIPRSELKSMAGEKRGFGDVGERSELEQNKRVKMKDLESVFRSEIQGVDNTSYTKSWINRHATEISYDKGNVTMNPDAIQLTEMTKGTSQPIVGSSTTALDLNAKVDMTNLDNDNTPCADDAHDQNTDFKLNVDKSRDVGFDLNVEDDSSSANHDLNLIDDLECGSTCGPMEKKDPLKVWKEMKQNGFMSSSHGGVPIPKPRGRKSKADTLKKKMEIARKEQVDRFARVAAPSGLLNGLNPGIINHVRNSKQVHSIIEALVRSERGDNIQNGNKEENVQMRTERIESTEAREGRNLNLSRMKRYNLCHEEGILNNASRFKQTNDSRISSENTRGINVSSMNMSTQCDEDATDFSSVSSLSFKVANVASQWLELLQLDIKGRLGALRRSKKRVRAVIQTELPLLISRELSHNQENDPYVTRISDPNSSAEMHKARWNALFSQMEKALSEEEIQLENWLNQVKEMQLQCDRGLSQNTGAPGLQQQGISGTDCRIENPKDSERVLAVRAAAAAFYSTCNFSQSVGNSPCF